MSPMSTPNPHTPGGQENPDQPQQAQANPAQPHTPQHAEAGERHDPREGLWDPERPVRRRPAPTPSGPRKRALPRSRVSLTLWLMIALVIVAALVGLFT